MSTPASPSDPPSIYWSKALTSILIEAFRQKPCLWNVKLRNYKNRDQRVTALKAIAAEIRDHDAAVTTDDIKKKIDTLRNQFRRELKKVNNSKKSGAGTEDVFVPKLWCFQQLTFLTDSETPRPSTSNMDTLHNPEDGADPADARDTSDTEVCMKPHSLSLSLSE